MTRTRLTIPLVVLSIALGYAAARQGGDTAFDTHVALLIVAVGTISAIVLWSGRDSFDTFDGLDALALVFPAYVAFQLVPLPLPLLRLVSPARATIADALQPVAGSQSFAAITISAPTTWAHLLRISGYVLVFVVIRQIVRQSSPRVWLPVIPLMVIGLIETAFALTMASANPQESSGTFASRNHLAGLLEMILPFVLMYGLTLLYRGRQRGGFSTSAALLGSAGVIAAIAVFLGITASLSKGGVFATLISLLTMAALAMEGRLSGVRRLSVVAGLAVLALVALLFLTPIELVQRFGNFASDEITEGRIPIFKDTSRLAAAFPLVGVGLGNLYPALMPYQTYGLDLAWVHAHNDYLQLLAELGIVGWLIPALLIAAATVVALRAARAARDREVRAFALACTGALTAILIHSLGEFNSYVLSNAMLLAWVAAVASSLPAKIATTNVTALRRWATVYRSIVLGLSVLLAVYAAGWLFFIQRYSNSPEGERMFCRFGICDSEAAIAALLDRQALAGGTTLSPEQLKTYLLRDPAAPYDWDLYGEALQKARRTAEARYCFSRALALGPNFPPTLLMAADFYFDVEEPQTAFPLLSRILEIRGSDRAVFAVLSYRDISAASIVRHVLPDRRSAQAYLRSVIEEGRIREAEVAWGWMVPRGYIDDPLAARYVDFLLGNKKPEAATRDWSSYASGRSEGYPDANRIFNGNFEHDPSGSALDWRLGKTAGALVDFDRETKHSGGRSLRIRFDGTANPADLGVVERVFLAPGQYRFRAFVRTLDLSTDEGIAVRVVFDESPPQLDWSTEKVRGTKEWTVLEGVFAAPPAGGLVSVRLVRRPSLKFDNLLSGTAWVDAVSLSPETP